MKTSNPPPTPQIPVEVLLSLHDEKFVNTAYTEILGRAPDSDGLAHYLAQVRSGTDKAEIITNLANSTEGRCHSARMKELLGVTEKYGGRVRFLFAWVSKRLSSRRAQSIERQLRIIENDLYLVKQTLAQQTDLVIELVATHRLAELEAGNPDLRPDPSNEGDQVDDSRPSPETQNIGRTFRELKSLIARERDQ